MLSRFNPKDIEAALLSVPRQLPFPPATDRTAWGAVRQTIGEEQAAEMIAQAEDAARTPIPFMPATLYLEFQRVGQREGYQMPRSKRQSMLASLVLAECLEGKGRFLDPILDLAWAICEESSWVLPAHQTLLTDMLRPVIDLGSSMTSLMLAEMDALVGAQLDPLLGERIRYEVDRRSFAPYLTRHDHWWLYNSRLRQVNNWTAVCNAGVVGAALYLEKDPSRLAEMVARAARSMDDYLDTFDQDGGSSEGPGYWSYGFGYYTILAQLVEQRTRGQIAFMDEPAVRKAAQFPLRTMLSPGVYVNFSDCDRDIHFIAAHLDYLSRRLELPELTRLARVQPREGRRLNELTWALRDLFWRPAPEPAGDFVPAKQDWFNEMQWMLARFNPADPNSLALAVKGGHNEEMHNQNDVGNFVVQYHQETLIPDIGRGRYTKFYFGPDRYKHFVNSSRGHSLPRPNGMEQAPGKQFAAVLLDHQTGATVDAVKFELKGAYPPEAGLATLVRSVILHRDGPHGWVELEDQVGFASTPSQCDSALTTFSPVELVPGAVLIRGEKGALRVSYDPGVVTPRVEVEKDVDFSSGPLDVNVILFAFNHKVTSGTIRLRIEPLPGRGGE